LDFEALAEEAEQHADGIVLVADYRAQMDTASCGPCARNKLRAKLRVFLAEKGIK